ncbi:MAG: hypothetical protein ACUVUQ_11855, partial [Thermodesulfovibrionales bacterium]
AEQDIINTIEFPDSTDREGDRLIAIKKFFNKFSDYPLKVVYKETSGEIRIITAYPLKKKHWR